MSGGLCALAAELPCAPLVFLGLLPWLLALDRAPRLGHALFGGGALAVAFSALVFPWFPAAMERYSGLPPAVTWALFLLFAPLFEPQFFALAAARHLLRRTPVLAALTASASYVVVELAAPKLFFDTLGQGLYPSTILRQGAALAGVHGLTLAVLLVAQALAAPRRRAALLSAAALLAAWVGWGLHRRAALEGAPTTTLEVGVVQARLTSYELLRAERGAYETVALILDTHAALSDSLLSAPRPPALLVWPESVYPTTFGAPRSEDGAAFDRALEGFVTERGLPLYFGAYDAEAGREYNAAFLLSPAGAARPERQVYRKHMLFPLTEQIPPALDGPLLRRLAPWAGTWSRGQEPRPLSLPLPDRPARRLLPLICYDALVPSLTASARAQGADLILTLSNDSWFPDARAPRLHLRSAAFRSVESGLPQVRATTSGISALIDAGGELREELPWDRAEARVFTARLSSLPSPPAVRWIPRLPWITGLVALAGALAGLQARSKR